MKKAETILLGLMTLLCILLITNEITVMLERFVQSEELPIAAEDQQNSSIDGRVNTSIFGNNGYPSARATVADLLCLEKLQCVLHDNFSRADNSWDIGSNVKNYFYNISYEDIASGTGEPDNIEVGISDYRAVAFNPHNTADAKRFKVKDVGMFPYKISMQFDKKGVIVISPLDTDNYLSVECTNNSCSVEGHGSITCEKHEIIHNGDTEDVEIYVFKSKVKIYIAGQQICAIDVDLQNTKCGLYFSSEDIDLIAYTNFDLFIESEYIQVGLDNAVETCGNISPTFLGTIKTADTSYGITFDTENVCNSQRSLKFEQRREDSVNGIYRSEITPPYMRQYNYNLQTKILDYDILFPDSYEYDSTQEILWQQHNTPDGVNPDGMYPNICFKTKQDKMQIGIRSYDRTANSADDAQETVFDIGNVERGKWIHMTVFIREGYIASQHPCVAVWVDGELRLMSRIPNAYNTIMGSYFKMGMYKTAWAYKNTETTSRIVYYDNINIWQ